VTIGFASRPRFSSRAERRSARKASRSEATATQIAMMEMITERMLEPVRKNPATSVRAPVQA